MSELPASEPKPIPRGEDHSAAGRIELIPISGIGELRPGDDLAAQIAEHAELRAGDVLVVTSKAISKIENRLIILGTADPGVREKVRLDAIESETIRVVARRGPLSIVETRHGLVLAAAGVDASNVARNELALLPLDPDASARALREALTGLTGVEVGIVISDSMGRPWRAGITDAAIGVAGMSAMYDARGQIDHHGNELAVTEVAVADELAAAADLVKGKLTGIPVAIVRGLAREGTLPDDGRGSRTLLRGAGEDLFRLGTAEAIAQGREDIGAAVPQAPDLHRDAVRVIAALPGADRADAALRQGFLGFLAARPDAMWRSCAAGHLTASALVVEPASQTVLLTLHRRLGQWLQVGGHCEQGDNTLLDAAAREAREETGIGSLSFDPTPLGLDVHPLTCSLGVPTRHFDVRFLALAPQGSVPVLSDESLDLRWFSWDALPADSAPELPRLIDAARARLAQ